MAEIVQNPIEKIYQRWLTEIVEAGAITATQQSFGNNDIGAQLPWIAFKPMTNYTWLQVRNLENDENGIVINIQIECFASKESVALRLEDKCKEIMFGMGFYSTGFAQRFRNNNVHRYITRFAMNYTGWLLGEDTTTGSQQETVTNP